MRKKNLVCGVMVFLFLVASSFLVLSKYQIRLQERQYEPIKLPSPQLSGKCGIENCHGLEITCGSNISEQCTMEYALGDRCRQYVSCKVVNGECRLIESAKFKECKSCVENCLRDFKDDSIRLFECESQCGK